MDYIQSNKLAWEDAFRHRKPGWGDDNAARLLSEHLPFLHPDIVRALESMDFRGKTVAQFCCNNGRELLSLMQLGTARGYGFDIAENLVAQARETAKAVGAACTFEACNLLELPAQYAGQFDFIFFTVGALPWFRELDPVFALVKRCLKPGGALLIHDSHPFLCLLPVPGEETYREGEVRVAYPYFRDTPWLENSGMGYLSETYDSPTFTSFTHTVSDIIGGVLRAGLRLERFEEYAHDVGITPAYDGKALPLSYLLLARNADA